MKNFIYLFLLLGITFCFNSCLGTTSATAQSQKDNDKQTNEEPYERSKKASYENKLRYTAFAPFLYEDKFYAFYSLANTPSKQDKNGYSEAVLKNGPKAGQVVKTKNIIYQTSAAKADELKKGQVVLVNHWNPKVLDEDARIDIWRKGVVYNLDELDQGKVMLEFPHDKNDFMATKENYLLQNIRIIKKPIIKDPRNFID